MRTGVSIPAAPGGRSTWTRTRWRPIDRCKARWAKSWRRKSLQAEDGTFSFRLTAEERCPFLRQDHLCELICELGPERLCQVCADHPRYRNFYTDRVEIGLGLCCEEAARQQLTREAPFRLVVLADDGGGEALSPEEAALLRDREALLDITRDRTRPLNARVRELMQLAGMEAAPDMRAWASFFLKLERLDPAWTALLEELAQTPCAPLLPESLSLPGEQLLCCLLYRHLPAALEDGCIQPRLVFVLRCWLLIAALTNAHRAASLPAFLSLVRLFLLRDRILAGKHRGSYVGDVGKLRGRGCFSKRSTSPPDPLSPKSSWRLAGYGSSELVPPERVCLSNKLGCGHGG